MLRQLVSRRRKPAAAVVNDDVAGLDRAARRRAYRAAHARLQPVPARGPSRADSRARLYGPRPQRSGLSSLLGERQDKAAVQRLAYQAGCHGHSVAPLEATDLRATYGPHPTPKQARRIRKADHVEAGR